MVGAVGRCCSMDVEFPSCRTGVYVWRGGVGVDFQGIHCTTMCTWLTVLHCTLRNSGEGEFYVMWFFATRKKLIFQKLSQKETDLSITEKWIKTNYICVLYLSLSRVVKWKQQVVYGLIQLWKADYIGCLRVKHRRKYLTSYMPFCTACIFYNVPVLTFQKQF